MKNITVSVDDDLYLRARNRAANDGTTISAVVKDVLRDYSNGGTEAEMRARALQALFDHVDAKATSVSTPMGLEPGWRDRMYDERFENSILGRAHAALGS